MSYQKVELELASDIHQSEDMEQDTLAQKTKKDKERFEKIGFGEQWNSQPT